MTTTHQAGDELDMYLRAGARPAARRWEYVVTDIASDPESLHTTLNRYGAYGWELVSMMMNTSTTIAGVNLSGPGFARCTFKRSAD